jgi:hypothetical protein
VLLCSALAAGRYLVALGRQRLAAWTALGASSMRDRWPAGRVGWPLFVRPLACLGADTDIAMVRQVHGCLGLIDDA